MSRGNSSIVGPDGDLLAGPLIGSRASSPPTSTSDASPWRAASSIRSATTRDQTCSASTSTPDRNPP